MPQWDLANADCIVVMGSNMAENHPIAFRFVHAGEGARRDGHPCRPALHPHLGAGRHLRADPRRARDIAFLGGIIHYILENDLWFQDYALAYTNLADDHRRAVPGRRASSTACSPAGTRTSRAYKYDSWQYEGEAVPSPLAEHYVNTHARSFGEQTKRMTRRRRRRTTRRCSTRTASTRSCGATTRATRRRWSSASPAARARRSCKVAEALARNSGRERTGAFCYAVGWTHHTTGVQMIRAAAIIQGLLGNIGRPGGGILALRGHCSIQGSTDIPTLYNMLPTYLPQPHALQAAHDAEGVPRSTRRAPTGWWHNFPKYIVSLLRPGTASTRTPENDWGYELAAEDRRRSFAAADDAGDARRRRSAACSCSGQNPVVGGQQRATWCSAGWPKLDWLVVRDIAETETASFWYKGRPVQRRRAAAARTSAPRSS